jgi:hypothetical protein
MTRPARLALPLEVAAVWLLLAAAEAAIFVTYSRLPAGELYHVSGTGLSGGAGRMLVSSNFPVALVAIVALAVLADRLSSRVATASALVGSALCAAVFWPGVVDQADLDAKPVNAIAALGVLIALALTTVASRQGAEWSGRRAGDRIRLAAAAGALFIGLPWIAAELGFFLTGVPGLSRVFQTGRYIDRPPYAGEDVSHHAVVAPVVHHGSHHGMDAVLLLLTAVVVSRVVPSMRRRRLRIAAGAYLALIASYAIGNIANDFWTEQVVKRGWTTWMVPDVLRPKLTVAWGLIVLGAALLYAASAWWSRRSYVGGAGNRPRRPAPPVRAEADACAPASANRVRPLRAARSRGSC